MKGVCLMLALGLVATVGCSSTPKREMRQPMPEELMSPGPNEYLAPADFTRGQPVLQPKQATPGLNTGGMPGTGGPPGPGMGPMGAGGMRR